MAYVTRPLYHMLLQRPSNIFGPSYRPSQSPFATPRMPSDDYAPLGGGGALKLKGSKVEKKKKKKKPKSDLEKNLAVAEIDESKKAAKSPEAAAAEGEQLEERQAPQKTEAEKRHEEIRRKRVRDDSSRGT